MKSERFSTSEKIKDVLAPVGKGVGGSVLHCDNGEIWVYPGEKHDAIIGGSGTGKTLCGSLPKTRALIEAGENIVAVDPKAEMFNQTASYANKTHKVYIVNFCDPSHSHRWNPLRLVRELHDS